MWLVKRPGSHPKVGFSSGEALRTPTFLTWPAPLNSTCLPTSFSLNFLIFRLQIMEVLTS